MLLAAVETSTARSSVALATEDGVVASAALGRDRRHGEFVSPALRELLHHLGADVGDITGVVCGVGPGLYTGLRVGMVSAMTLGTTLAVPAVGLPGPAALAHRARHTDRDVAVVLDARRREVFLSLHPRGADGEHDLLVAPTVATGPEATAALVAHGRPLLLVGDGLHRLGPELDAVDTRVGGPDLQHPDAAHLALLAIPRFLAGATVDPQSLRPVYLRDADAAIPWDARSRMAGGAAPG